MEFTVYEMQYCKKEVPYEEISCVSFDPARFEEYKTIYNAGFYEMRKALGIEPYDFLHSFEQIEEKTKDIALCIIDGEIAGTVACYGNEVDDLVVSQKFQKQGYGRKLLLWAMKQIRERSAEPITLHVAAWNEHAHALYKKTGFEITKETVIVR